MSSPAGKVQKNFCYRNYLELPPDKKYEVINGILYAMTPSPTIHHQRILRKLFLHIGNYFTDKDCEVFSAPCDVLLPEENEDIDDVKTVIQPDILVVCDKTKLTEKHCVGPPDFIIEIASPSSASMDYVKKLQIYEKHRVREYWIVNYGRKDIMVYKLQDNEEYGAPEIYRNGEIVSGIFENLRIPLDVIFA